MSLPPFPCISHTHSHTATQPRPHRQPQHTSPQSHSHTPHTQRQQYLDHCPAHNTTVSHWMVPRSVTTADARGVPCTLTVSKLSTRVCSKSFTPRDRAPLSRAMVKSVGLAVPSAGRVSTATQARTHAESTHARAVRQPATSVHHRTHDRLRIDECLTWYPQPAFQVIRPHQADALGIPQIGALLWRHEMALDAKRPVPRRSAVQSVHSIWGTGHGDGATALEAR